MNKKSLGINAVLNGIKTLMSVIFPLITFPYVSKILQVDNLGKCNFAQSVTSYFLLLAALGISTYSIREGAQYRDDKKAFNRFASEVYSINLISMIFAYILLIICILCVGKLHGYAGLIMLYSIDILFTTIGKDWINSIYEEYTYITLRSILFQTIAMILLFVFVKNQDDFYKYVIIMVFSTSGANLINYIVAKRKYDVKIIFNKDIIKHLVPILIIFSSNIATTIYVNSDITILGFLTDDYHVGVYSVAVKIYKVVKSVLSGVLLVSVPRLSAYWGQKKEEEFNDTLNKIIKAIITLLFPVFCGMYILSKHMVIILSDNTYLDAVVSLRLLSIAVLFSMFSYIFTSCVLIPCKREKKVLIATIFSALINIILNFVLIPFWKENAAAFTTILAEACSMIMCMYFSKDIVKIENMKRTLFSTLIGTVLVSMICLVFVYMNLGTVVTIVLAVLVSVVAYSVILIVLKNEAMILVLEKAKMILKRKK